MKHHIPKQGYSAGRQGAAKCGRYTIFPTGDYTLIFNMAYKEILADEIDEKYWCQDCLRRLKAEMANEINKSHSGRDNA